jgi:hypothetical protein
MELQAMACLVRTLAWGALARQVHPTPSVQNRMPGPATFSSLQSKHTQQWDYKFAFL